jgi:hypothetical protein
MKRLCGADRATPWSLRSGVDWAVPLCRVARLGAGARVRGRVVNRGSSFGSRALRSASGAVPGASAGGEQGRVVDQ